MRSSPPSPASLCFLRPVPSFPFSLGVSVPCIRQNCEPGAVPAGSKGSSHSRGPVDLPTTGG